jgi:hypothetical protein
MSAYEKFKRKYLQYDESQEHIVDQYIVWVNDTKYMIMGKKSEVEIEYFAVKCAKRGNDVYRWSVSKRFNKLLSGVEDVHFFNRKDRGIKKTRALFITLTFNTKICSWEEAWESSSRDFNRFMANVRKRFGGISCCRVYEASSKGYPHIHCILLFDCYEFSVFRDSRGRFRIRSKTVFDMFWHSFVDVQAMDRVGGGLGYIKKYMLKCVDVENSNSKTVLTLALTWTFRKRSFSISGKFHYVLREMYEKNNGEFKDEKYVKKIVFFIIGFFFGPYIWIWI